MIAHALASVALSALIFHVGPALACSCVPQSVAQAKQDAVAIFEGRVTTIVDAPETLADVIPEQNVTLSVVRSWRALENQQTVTLRTAKSGASCGYMFELGTSYLVYAGGEPDKLTVHSCSRTRLMREVSEDLAALGSGVAPGKVDLAQEQGAPAPAKARSGGCASGRAGASAAVASWLAVPVIALFAPRRWR